MEFDITVSPKIHPERLNITAKIGDTVILPCNTTGIPEPVVFWMKMPDVSIIGNEESKASRFCFISTLSNKFFHIQIFFNNFQPFQKSCKLKFKKKN